LWVRLGTVLNSHMLWHYLQTLDYDRKACKEQTLKLIWPVDKL
jgi:hypothetical protein